MTVLLRRGAAATALCLAAMGAAAQRPVYTERRPSYEACASRAASRHAARAECAQVERRRQMRRMNEALAAVQPFLTDWERMILVPPAAHAQRTVYDAHLPNLKRCADSPRGQSPMGRATCAGEEEARQDERMQAALVAILPRLDSRARRQLRGIQDAWRNWLDGRCEFINAEPDSGSEADDLANLCAADTIAERADELQALRALIAPAVPTPPRPAAAR